MNGVLPLFAHFLSWRTRGQRYLYSPISCRGVHAGNVTFIRPFPVVA